MVKTKGQGVSFGNNKNILKQIVVMDAKLSEYTKSHWSVYFKLMNCTVFELYPNKVVKNKKKQKKIFKCAYLLET